MTPRPARPWIVVVAWRADARTAAPLDHLAAVAPAIPVLLVDNESAPRSLAAALAGRATVHALPHAANLGFAGGANAGLEEAFGRGATHAILLNDDLFPEPGCLEALVALAGDDGCAGPTFDAPGDDAFAGGLVDRERGFGLHRPGARDFLTGAALCLSRAAWERTGPFDERFFLYYEDVDWCVRARACGVPLRVSEARARHEAGSSSGGGHGATWGYYDSRNRLLFLEGQRGRPHARRDVPRSLWDVAGYLRHGGPPRVAAARVRGIVDWARGRTGRGPYPPRRGR